MKVLIKNEGSCRQTLTRRYVSNTTYFAEDEIVGELLIAKWDLIWSQHFKKATTNREILNMNGLDYTVTRGKDYTIDKHIRQKFGKVGHTPSAKEVANVIECDIELYKDLVQTSCKQIKYLI